MITARFRRHKKKLNPFLRYINFGIYIYIFFFTLDSYMQRTWVTRLSEIGSLGKEIREFSLA